MVGRCCPISLFFMSANLGVLSEKMIENDMIPLFLQLENHCEHKPMPQVIARCASPRRPLTLFEQMRFLLLPAAAQRSIELYQCVQLISLRLGKVQFGGKIVGLVGQYFQIARGPALVSHIGEARRILGRLRQ